MDLRSDGRVLEVIGIAIPLVAKVEPCLRVLVNKQRRKGANVAQAVVFESHPLPREPSITAKGMRCRSHSEQVHHHEFAVKVPTRRNESDLWRPSMRKQTGIFRQPSPIDAVEYRAPQRFDVAVPVKVLSAGKHSAQQDGCIDRGHLRVPDPFTGVDICKVEIESAMGGQLMPKERERLQNPQSGIRVRNVTAFLCNADCSEPKAAGRDAGRHI